MTPTLTAILYTAGSASIVAALALRDGLPDALLAAGLAFLVPVAVSVFRSFVPTSAVRR